MIRRTVLSRRSSLLAALIGLCLVVLAGLPTATSRPAAARAGDAVVAAVGDAAVVARTSSARLMPAHRSGADRHVPPIAALPAAVFVAPLLAARLRTPRRAAVPRAQLLAAAGRGPPVTS